MYELREVRLVSLASQFRYIFGDFAYVADILLSRGPLKLL